MTKVIKSVFSLVLVVVFTILSSLSTVNAYTADDLQPIVFMENFSSGNITPVWSILSGTPTIVDDGSGTNNVLRTPGTGTNRVQIVGGSWDEASVSAEANVGTWNATGQITLNLKYRNATNNYFMTYVHGTTNAQFYVGEYLNSATATNIISKTFVPLTSGKHTFKFEFKKKGNLTAYIDGAVVGHVLDILTPQQEAGTVAISSTSQIVDFDNIVVKKPSNILYDNFDGGLTYPATVSQANCVTIAKGGASSGWTAATDGGRKVITSTGQIAFSDSAKIYYNIDPGATVEYNAAEGGTWTNYIVSAKIKSTKWDCPGTTGTLLLQSRVKGTTNNYKLSLYNRTIYLQKQTASTTTLGTSSQQSATLLSNTDNVYHDIALETKNNANGTVTLNAYIDDMTTPVVTGIDDGVTNGPIILSGGVSLISYGTFTAWVDELMIKDLNPNPQLNAYAILDKYSLVGGQTVTANIYLTNKTAGDTPKPVISVIALYDASNKMVGISDVTSTTVSKNTNGSLVPFIQIPSDYVSGSGYKVRAFVWSDLDVTMMPLCNIATLTN